MGNSQEYMLTYIQEDPYRQTIKHKKGATLIQLSPTIRYNSVGTDTAMRILTRSF